MHNVTPMTPNKLFHHSQTVNYVKFIVIYCINYMWRLLHTILANFSILCKLNSLKFKQQRYNSDGKSKSIHGIGCVGTSSLESHQWKWVFGKFHRLFLCTIVVANFYILCIECSHMHLHTMADDCVFVFLGWSWMMVVAWPIWDFNYAAN